MKNFKYFFLSLVVALGMVSCANEYEYQEGTATGMQVYFSNEGSRDIKVTDNDDHFALTVMRQDVSEAVTIPVSVMFSEGAETRWILTSSEVSFAAGENATSLVFTFDPAEIKYDVVDTIAVAITDAKYATQYGSTEAVYTVSKPAPYTYIGTGVVVEDYYFGGEAEVKFYQNDLNPNLYRIESPTVAMLKAWGESISPAASPWLFVRLLQPGDVVYGETITERGLVMFYGDGQADSFNSGYTNPTYDDDVCFVWPGTFTKYPSQSDWAYNCIKDYKEDGSVGAVQLAPFYYMFSVGGWDKTQVDGDMLIYFPGYEPVDNNLDIKFEGRLIDAKENGSVLFTITLGADVASAKYLMEDGKDVMAIYEKVLAGAEGVQEITQSGQVKIAYEEGGDKTIVVVGYDKEGNEVNAIYTTINIPTGGDEKETWSALFVGDYYHCAQSYSQSGGGVWTVKYPDAINSGSILYISDKDESRYKVAPWIDGELIFTMDADYNIAVDNADTGVPNDGIDIAASDFITAGVANLQSTFNAEYGQFVYYLAWHDIDDLESGFWGFTADIFNLTGEASAPSNVKLSAPMNKLQKKVKKNLNYKLEKDVVSTKSIVKPFKNFEKQTFRKTARIK